MEDAVHHGDGGLPRRIFPLSGPLLATLSLSALLAGGTPAGAQQPGAQQPGATVPRPGGAYEATAEEEAAVLAVLDTFFEAMALGDSAAFAAVQVPEGMTFSRRTDPGGPHPVRIRDQASLAAGIGAGERLLERIWDPEVRVHGPLAAVWTPYDFHVDGQFSHCGVDLFTLFRIEGEWKITGVSWTVETEGCEPSPLGPPAEPVDAGLPYGTPPTDDGPAGPRPPAADAEGTGSTGRAAPDLVIRGAHVVDPVEARILENRTVPAGRSWTDRRAAGPARSGSGRPSGGIVS